jgi:arylsulfatase A-like enzyme
VGRRDDQSNYWQYWVERWKEGRRQVVGEGRDLSPAEWAAFEDRYDGAIAYMDEQVGRLLNWLRQRKLYDRSLIFITADHGEAFGEHGLFGHAFRLYQPEVAAPMIVKLPGGSRKGVVDYGVQHVDVMPTTLDVLGLPIPREVQGISMLQPSERQVLVAESHVFPKIAKPWPQFNSVQHALYKDELKYIQYSDGHKELFDLALDPAEQHDLASSRQDDVLAFGQILDQWAEHVQPLEESQSVPVFHDPEREKRLKDLGYFGGN